MADDSPHGIRVQLRFVKKPWTFQPFKPLESFRAFRHRHIAEAELPFDPSKFEETWHFEGKQIHGIKLWNPSKESEPGLQVYRWGIWSHFAFLHPFTWNKQELWNLELTPIANDSSGTTWKGSGMNSINIDPSKVQEFIQVLDVFTKTVREQTQRLNAKQRDLKASWNDLQYEKFSQEFEEAAKIITRFLDKSEQQKIYLRKKLKGIEPYHQR